jgi:hypothetical protein
LRTRWAAVLTGGLAMLGFLAVSRSCHPERSEGFRGRGEVLRFAQDDFSARRKVTS